jgi:hypothetical protein
MVAGRFADPVDTSWVAVAHDLSLTAATGLLIGADKKGVCQTYTPFRSWACAIRWVALMSVEATSAASSREKPGQDTQC